MNKIEKIPSKNESGFVATYPSLLFEKNLTLDIGDMTIELYSFRGMHTNSDIVIFVSEEGLLVVGDMAPDRWIPYFTDERTATRRVQIHENNIEATWQMIMQNGENL